MTIEDALAFGRNQLTLSPTPAIDARLLLQHVLSVSHSHILAFPERRLSADEQGAYMTLLARAAEREPIPYLIGHVAFRHLTLTVSPAVLIPRSETEELVERALAWAAIHRPRHVVDVGTGSGCIALSLAQALPEVVIDAVDISAESLAVAQHNAAQNHIQNVRFHHGSLLQPMTHPLDLIVANLPYVTEAEWTHLDDGVKYHEPRAALVGGPDGVTLIDNLLQQATAKLHLGGALLLEIGWQQGEAVAALARRSFPTAAVNVYRDLSGNDRIVSIETDQPTDD